MTTSCSCTQTLSLQYSGPSLSFDGDDFAPVPAGQQLGTWGDTTDNRRIQHTFVLDIPDGCEIIGGRLRVEVARESLTGLVNNDTFSFRADQGATIDYAERIWPPDRATELQRSIDVDLNQVGLGVLSAGQLSFLIEDDTTALSAELTLEICCSCDSSIADINEQLAETTAGHPNSLVACGEKVPTFPGDGEWHPLEAPTVEPKYHVTWGDSECDCLESDDLETMHLVICNPYSNVTLSDVTVPFIRVVDESGNPVPTLPDGTPSVEAIPAGPFCFGDIGPCSCVSRSFVLRNRGAATDRKYRIVVDEICFATTFCHRSEACFEFVICAD